MTTPLRTTALIAGAADGLVLDGNALRQTAWLAAKTPHDWGRPLLEKARSVQCAHVAST